jgi:3-oxoacyl-[acyl-carrier protein] reductase
MFNLTGKTALITGASGGIGNAVAKVMHAAGANVVLTGTREEALKQLVSELGDRAKYVVANLSNTEDLTSLYDKADQAFPGGVDVLVCNAGITRDNLAMRMKDEEWDEVVKVNLTASFKLNRDAIKKMVKKRFGRIINITSVVSFAGNFGQANYVAAKSGVTGFSKSLALECASRGITVNCIAPGFIETPMTDVLRDEIKAGIKQRIPMDKMGTPLDIAHAALYLASNEAGYVTGTTLHVNGGMYM